jgi:hypothetical protein
MRGAADGATEGVLALGGEGARMLGDGDGADGEDRDDDGDEVWFDERLEELRAPAPIRKGAAALAELPDVDVLWPDELEPRPLDPGLDGPPRLGVGAVTADGAAGERLGLTLAATPLDRG